MLLFFKNNNKKNTILPARVRSIVYPFKDTVFFVFIQTVSILFSIVLGGITAQGVSAVLLQPGLWYAGVFAPVSICKTCHVSASVSSLDHSIYKNCYGPDPLSEKGIWYGKCMMQHITYPHHVACTATNLCTDWQKSDCGQLSPLLLLSDHFYMVLFSALEQTRCTHVSCDSEWVTVAFYIALTHTKNPLKLCSDSAIWLCGWCHMKLLPSQHTFCVHHTTMHIQHFNFVCKSNFVVSMLGCPGACVCVWLCICNSTGLYRQDFALYKYFNYSHYFIQRDLLIQPLSLLFLSPSVPSSDVLPESSISVKVWNRTTYL